MHIRWCKKSKDGYRMEFDDGSQSDLLVRLAALGQAKPFVGRRGIAPALVWDVSPLSGIELFRVAENGMAVWATVRAGEVYTDVEG